MRIIKLIPILIFIISCQNKNKVKTDILTNIDKPKIKSICQTDFSNINNNELDVINFSSLACREFDLKGNVIKSTKFNLDGTFDYKNCKSYFFDVNNNLIKEQTYNKDGTESERTIYKYNNKNDKVESTSYAEDDYLTWKGNFTYDYDENDSILKHTYYSKSYFDAEIGGSYEYKYDIKGNMTEMLSRDLSGKQNLKYTYEYNNNGKLLKESHYDANNKLEQISSYKRDQNGNTLEFHQKNFHYKDSKSLYKYNEKGNKTETIELDENNNLIKKSKYYYNDENSVVKSLIYNSSNKLEKKVEYERVFNEFGDCIETKQFTNGKLKSITKLEITYY